MNKAKRRSYHSPLREAQARETRARILVAVATWLERGEAGEFTLAAVARTAGIERRTVFRHFPTREALLGGFWEWINHRITPRTLPASLEELIAAPRETFAGFDAEEGVIRASLHSGPGRAMRLATVPARRKAFRSALREATRGTTAAERGRLEAVVHALYSAAAWEAMRDYAGVSGKEAGEAASWALAILVGAVRDAAARARD